VEGKPLVVRANTISIKGLTERAISTSIIEAEWDLPTINIDGRRSGNLPPKRIIAWVPVPEIQVRPCLDIYRATKYNRLRLSNL